jgi:hypothetical protein
MKIWTALAVAVAAVLFGLALSNEVYALTSPPSLSWHVLLRKAYSIGAFAILGYVSGRAAYEWRLKPTIPGLTLAVGLYSAAIEVAQFLNGSTEGLGWNVFDTACGAVGGLLAGIALRFTPRRARGRRPR